MKQFGLIGYPLTHSFSKKYFSEKFKKEKLKGFTYEHFSIENLNDFQNFVEKNKYLHGLNVTTPFKELITTHLDEIEPVAESIGAVNTIKFKDGKLIGYNTDIVGFEKSAFNWIKEEKRRVSKALILGTGGASKAVKYVLNKNNIDTLTVSRSKRKGDILYDELNTGMLNEYTLIINTTPLGTYPDVNNRPDIPYGKLSPKNMLFDLVYNPEKTLYLKAGARKRCPIKNGFEMLELQAEASWNIWNE